MKFLVTGGAGFLGINLIRYLTDRGHIAKSLDRAPFAYPEAETTEVLQGDIRDPAIARKAVQDVDTVLHCAAALPLYSPQEIHSNDVDGTRVMLEAAVDAGVSRFTHISSTAVYGVPDHHPIYEHDPVSGVGPYGVAKIEAEEVCTTFRGEGLCVPVLRLQRFLE